MTSTKPKRYFLNGAQEYSGNEVSIPRDHLQQVCLKHVQHIVARFAPSHTEGDGLYLGVVGVAYMFYHLARSEAFRHNSSEYLKYSLHYLEPELNAPPGQRDDPTSFILGNPGTYAVASVVLKHLGDDVKSSKYLNMFRSLQPQYLPSNFKKCGGDELFVGRAGYLAGAFWLQKELKAEVLTKSTLHQICNSIVKSGRQYSHSHKSSCPLMYAYYGTEYIGAAHGLSFILEMLLSAPDFLDSDLSIKTDVKASIDYVLSLQTDSGNFPCALDEVGQRARSESDELVHWCHGAPGVIYLMAKAFLVFREEKYLQSCLKAGDLVWKKGLLKKGPGICHGVAGNGYVFLLLYRLTGDSSHLHRAIEFANFMESKEFERGASTPDNPYSLYEGVAGSVCYLVDLLNPDTAAFPFQDVFY